MHRNSTSGCITFSQKVQSVSEQQAVSFPPPPIRTYFRVSTIRWQTSDRGRRWNILNDREIGLMLIRMQIRAVCFRSATNSSDWQPSSMHRRVRWRTFRCLHARRTNMHRRFVGSRGRHSMKQTRSSCKVLKKSIVSNSERIWCVIFYVGLPWDARHVTPNSSVLSVHPSFCTMPCAHCSLENGKTVQRSNLRG